MTEQTPVAFPQQNKDLVKAYLKTVLTFKGLPVSLSPIILAFLQKVNVVDGSYVIYINKPLKEDIANSLGLSTNRLTQVLTELIKAGLFVRTSTGKYTVDPLIQGETDWISILSSDNIPEWREFSVTFDFINGTIRNKIVPKLK